MAPHILKNMRQYIALHNFKPCFQTISSVPCKARLYHWLYHVYNTRSQKCDHEPQLETRISHDASSLKPIYQKVSTISARRVLLWSLSIYSNESESDFSPTYVEDSQNSIEHNFFHNFMTQAFNFIFRNVKIVTTLALNETTWQTVAGNIIRFYWFWYWSAVIVSIHTRLRTLCYFFSL